MSYYPGSIVNMLRDGQNQLVLSQQQIATLQKSLIETQEQYYKALEKISLLEQEISRLIETNKKKKGSSV